MVVNNNITKQGELLSTFNDSSSKRTPIQSALTRPLVEAIGKCFLLLSGTTEEVQDPNDEAKTLPRAVYEVRVVSSRTRLPIGTVLTVKIKGSESVINEEENKKLLLGLEKNKVVAFDDLSHWNFNGNEGLSASNIRVLEVSPQEAMNL
ncbi:hypothetical protein [Lactobacillus sp. ESL0230]|uniref:hypothetical protein n=1 Tax=Lactobacillus sp. ESL0230 TaxID=2069353 RepID=UPI000EFAA69D|nr:hypothetical protein [Lactobacillus sp. ESL0230]RMC47758.1 hypothetical protein F5ESL0230_00090 [Lactobacillus sp. ESL0230]